MHTRTPGDPEDHDGGALGRDPAAPAPLSADERRELLLRYGNDVILLFDADFRLVDCNERAAEVYGLTREQLLGMSIGDLRADQPPIDLATRMDEIQRRGSCVFESVNRRVDGSTFPVEISVRAVETPGGTFYHATVRDISERLLARRELERREAEQRTVLTSLTETIVTLDHEGRITYLNHPEAGFGEGETLGSRWLEGLDEAARPEAEAALRRTIETGELQEMEFFAAGPDRGAAWYHVRVAPLPESSPDAVVLIAADVTVRRRAQRDLKDAAQRTLQAERTARLGHWRFDVRSGAFEPSDDLTRLVGASPGALPDDVEDLVHPDDREERRRVFERAVAGEAYMDHEWRAVRPDGSVRYLIGSAEPVLDEAGNVVAVFGVTQDVTERAEALLAARESAEQYRTLLENMLEGFVYGRIIGDDRGRAVDFVFLAANPAYYRLTGLSDAVGKRAMELLPDVKETNPEIIESYGRVAATGEPAEFDVELAALGKWLHVSATRPREGEFVAFLSDVTERIRAERYAKDSEERLRLSLGAANAGTWEWDLRTGENTWSDELWDLYGLDRDGRGASYDAWLESVAPDDREQVQQTLSAAVAAGRDLSFEWRVDTRDGSARWLLSRGSPERDDGEVVRYRGVVVDVTERRLALDALREREQSYSAIFNESPFAILLSHMPDATIVSANAAFLREFECTLDGIVGRTIPEVGITDEASIAAMAAELMQHGSVRDREVVRRTLGGREVTLSISLTHVSIGGEGHVLTTIRDVTDRKKAERDLEESEERFRSLFEHSPIAVFFSAPDGSVTAANPAACAMFGYGEQELIALGRSGIFDVGDVRLERALEERAVTGRIQGVELTAVRKGGERFPVEVDSTIIPTEPPRTFVMLRDITERKRMEEELRLSEAEARETVARLSRVRQIGRMGEWEWDVAAGTVSWSEEIYRIYGVPPDFQTTFDAIVPMTHPEDNEANLRATQAILDDPAGSKGALRFRIVRPDGAVRHIFQTLAVDRDLQDRPTRVFGIMQDVTELRETEEALVESERRFRRFYDAGLVGVVFWTVEGLIVDANDRYLEMVGYTREDLRAGRVDWAAMTPPEWAWRDAESLEELRATGRNAVPFEKEYYRKDGTRMPILVAGAMLDDDRTHGVAIVLDVSDQKRAEEELRRLNIELEDRVRRRTADLEAANSELEAFAYSVSHDLRAPLRHIAGFAQLLHEELGDTTDREIGHFLERIDRAAGDMGILIDDLLQFSRVGRTQMHVEEVDMRALVNEVLEVLRDDATERRVDVSIGEVLPTRGDRTLLRQVWANIVGNAFKYTRPRDPAVIDIGSQVDDGRVVYWVRDNGVGFEMEYVDRMFQVFERLHHSASRWRPIDSSVT